MWKPGCSLNWAAQIYIYLCVFFPPQGHNIFSNLSSTEYGDLMQLLKQSILATDLTLYFEYVLLIKLLNIHFHNKLPSSFMLFVVGFF